MRIVKNILFLFQGKTYFHKHFGSTDSENLMSKIRYLVRGCDCDYIVLDHINMVVSGIEGDERKLGKLKKKRVRL